jgi:Glycosyl hydrolases family 16
MYFSALSATTLALATVQLCSAQTFTSCDPTKKSESSMLVKVVLAATSLTLGVACPPDKALGKTITIDFTQGASDQFSLADGTTLTYGSNGAEFTMNKETDAPTITSNWYIFFGKVDVVMQAAPGTGIVSSFVMESDDLDEIDLVCVQFVDFCWSAAAKWKPIGMAWGRYHTSRDQLLWKG